jgi:Spy/CpxP family protein refolding chaperone
LKRVDPENVRAVRLGHGANCSSIGSVLDLLFATAAVGSAVFVAAAAAMSAPAERADPARANDEPGTSGAGDGTAAHEADETHEAHEPRDDDADARERGRGRPA